MFMIFMKSEFRFSSSFLSYVTLIAHIIIMDSTSFVTPQDTADAAEIDAEWIAVKANLFKLSYHESCNTLAEKKLTSIKTMSRNLFRKTSLPPINSKDVLNDLRSLNNPPQFFCNYSINLVCSDTTQKCECPEGLLWHKKHHLCITDYRWKNVLDFIRDAYNAYKEMSKTLLPLGFNDKCDFVVDSAIFQLVYSYEKYEHQRYDDTEDPVAAFNSLYAGIRSAWTLNLTEIVQPCNLNLGLKCSLKSKRCLCSTAEANHRFVRQHEECKVAKNSICTPSETEDDAYYSTIRYLPAVAQCEHGARCVSNVLGTFASCVNYRPNTNKKDSKYKVCKCK